MNLSSHLPPSLPGLPWNRNSS
uniref:Uncharacterized protein n=1 Tax=Arundo donax TaxID=35708 RepID=A0A0A9AEZ9_ARUDO